MSDKNEAISVRVARLNNIIVGASDGKGATSNSLSAGLTRESLLDAVSVLTNECKKDVLQRKDPKIRDFSKRCTYDVFVYWWRLFIEIYF